MSELPKAVTAAKIQEDLKKITKDLQKNDPQIPDPKPLDPEKNFEDLKQAKLGDTNTSLKEEINQKPVDKK